MSAYQLQRRLSVSTWSLHRSLGKPPPYGPAEEGATPLAPANQPAFSLLELPARIAKAGIHTLEICHFHLPSREPAYLHQLRNAMEAAGVELWSLLIDGGDISHPEHHQRNTEWSEGWLAVATELGAKNVRVSGGKQPPTAEAIQRSQANMAHLAAAAQRRNIRLMTENWHNLMSTPAAVLTVLDSLDGEVGLCADFGNWSGPDDLAQIFPWAESCHAKGHFSGPHQMDQADFGRCLELLGATDFAGPYTLIYDGPDGDEFAGLGVEREMVLPYL